MADKPADPRAIVRALEAAGVRYVVIGGWAAVTYGVDRATFDLDVVVDATDANASSLNDALNALAAERDLGAGVTEPVDVTSSVSLLAGPLRVVTMEGALDVLASAAGMSFSELRADARRATFSDGTSFVIASKQALEQLKSAMADIGDPARGDIDRRDLEELRDLPDPDLPPA